MPIEGKYTSSGDITLTWNIQENKLYSPDGLSHCLPCDHCGQPQWVSLPSVAVVCDHCALAVTDGN